MMVESHKCKLHVHVTAGMLRCHKLNVAFYPDLSWKYSVTEILLLFLLYFEWATILRPYDLPLGPKTRIPQGISIN